METISMSEKGYHKNSKNVAWEYSQITEHIYLGTNQCCQWHFNESLLAAGIRADISLEQERLDAPYGVDYFLWLPVPDKTPPSQEQLLIGSKMLKNLVDNNIKVYVHCKWGHGRSPMLVAAYFILEGLKANRAIKRVRQKREIHLNLSQIYALREFEKVVTKPQVVKF